MSRNDTQVATAYEANWQKLWAESQPWGADRPRTRYKDYLKMLGSPRAKVAEKTIYGGGGMLGSLGGTKIILDEDLPPDVCEFRNKEGKVLKRLRLE